MSRFLALATGLFTLVIASAASAHVDLDDPPMRADVNQKIGPCGNSPAGDPTPLVGGSTITVRWTETINHSGFFLISFDPDGDDFDGDGDGVSDYPAHPMVDGSGNGDGALVLVQVEDQMGMNEYSAEVSVPDVDCDNCTLQLIQMMTQPQPSQQNPTAHIYFRCADVSITSSGAGDDELGGAGGVPGDDVEDPGGAGGVAGGAGGAGSGGAAEGAGGTAAVPTGSGGAGTVDPVAGMPSQDGADPPETVTPDSMPGSNPAAPDATGAGGSAGVPPVGMGPVADATSNPTTTPGVADDTAGAAPTAANSDSATGAVPSAPASTSTVMPQMTGSDSGSGGGCALRSPGAHTAWGLAALLALAALTLSRRRAV